jgi:hypothetical protein
MAFPMKSHRIVFFFVMAQVAIPLGRLHELFAADRAERSVAGSLQEATWNCTEFGGGL